MRSLSGRTTGALIGGTFGGGFVLANASTPLGAQTTAGFRILAIAGLVGLYLAAGKARRQVRVRHPQVSRPTSEASVNLFGRRYWLIVTTEAALLGLGIGLLRAFGTPQPTNVAWITLIVGLHFIAFRYAGVWKYSITRSAAVLVGLGLAGLALAAASEPGWTSFVSGVLAGFVLLAGSLYAISRELLHNAAERPAASRHRRQRQAHSSDPYTVR